ncbi:MAG: PilW family protein [Myxococcota bacterium]|nr:PilW family protein [Myxococcota bacterium]
MKRLRIQYRRGFTLLELSIAVGLASFMVIALMSAFDLQARQLRDQDMQMEMNQNGRFGLEILARSIRLAGLGASSGVYYGALGYGGSGSSQPAVVSYDANGNNGQDAISVAYMEPSLTMNTSYSTIESCTTSSITFNPSFLDYGNKLRQLESGDLLMCQDYAAMGGQESYIWSITADAVSTSPFGVVYVDSSASSLSDYSAVCGSSENLSPVMQCSKGQMITFYIDDKYEGVGPGSSAHPVLMMDLNSNFPNNDDVPLVDDVEDLQLEYCVDDGTDTVNCNALSKWTDSFTAANITNLWGVRISLVLRSRKKAYQTNLGLRPKVANHSAASSNDKYKRFVVSTEVAVRNLRLLSAQ